MAATKDHAIELQRQQAQSGNDHAFIMGMLTALDVILDVRSQWTTRLGPEADAAWLSLTTAFERQMDGIQYLSCIADAEPANGPGGLIA